jgi:hypothetical protein
LAGWEMQWRDVGGEVVLKVGGVGRSARKGMGEREFGVKKGEGEGEWARGRWGFLDC